MQAEVTNIKKSKWLVAYSRAKTRAFTKLNIQEAWHGASLFSLNYQKVLRKLPGHQHYQDISITEPTTLVFDTSLISSSPPDSEALHTANNALKQALHSKNPLKTLEHNYIDRLTKTAERLCTQVSILERQLKELKEVVKVWREVKNGKHLALKHQLMLMKQELHETVAAIEWEKKKEKEKRGHKKRRKQEKLSESSQNDEEDTDDDVKSSILK